MGSVCGDANKNTGSPATREDSESMDKAQHVQEKEEAVDVECTVNTDTCNPATRDGNESINGAQHVEEQEVAVDVESKKDGNCTEDVIASTLKEERHIHELKVYGFVRIYAVTSICPDDITQLCIMFVGYVKDRWNVSILHDNLHVSTDQRLCIRQTKSARYRDLDEFSALEMLRMRYQAFGSHIITKGEIYEWNCKIGSDGIENKRQEHGAVMFVGISQWPISKALIHNLNNNWFSGEGYGT